MPSKEAEAFAAARLGGKVGGQPPPSSTLSIVKASPAAQAFAAARAAQSAAPPDATQSAAPEADPSGDGSTSKFRNLIATFAEGLPGILNGGVPTTMLPGLADALKQTGGDAGKAIALHRRAIGLGAGIVAGSMTLPLSAPVAATMGGSALLGAGVGALTNAITGAGSSLIDSAISGDNPKERNSKLAWGTGVGAVLGAGVGILHGMGAYTANKLAEATRTALADPQAVATAYRATAPGAIADMTSDIAATTDIHKQFMSDALKLSMPRSAKITLAQLSGNAQAQEDLAKVLGVPNGTKVEELLARAKQLGNTPMRAIIPRAGLDPLTDGDATASMAQAGRAAYLEHLGLSDTSELPGKIFPKELLAGAKQAAAKAAGTIKNGLLNDSIQGLTNINSAQQLVPLGVTDRGIEGLDRLVALRSLNSKWMYKTADLFRGVGKHFANDNQFFGQIGVHFADMMDHSANVADALQGSWVTHVNDTLKGLTDSDLKDLYKVIYLKGNSTNPKVITAAVQWKAVWNHIGDVSEAVKLPLQDRELSGLAAALKPDDLAKASKSVADAIAQKTPPVVRFMSQDAQNLVTKVMAQNGTIEEKGAVLVPFRKTSRLAPDMYLPAFKKAVSTGSGPEFDAAFNNYRRLNPGATKQQALDLFKDMLHVGDPSAPFEIRGQNLQWSHEAIFPDEARIQDLHHIMGTYVQNSARRLASAATYGPKDELFKQLMEQADQAKMAPEAQTMIQRAFAASQGRGEPTSSLVNFSRGAASFMFIGPKTFLMQPLQMSSVAAAHGFNNTVKGIASWLTQPELRNMAEVVGATSMDNKGELAGETFGQGVEKANIFLPMTRWADRQTRQIGAIAAGLNAQEQAANLLKDGPKQGIAIRWFSRLNMDPASIAQAGGKLNPEELRQSMAQGANQTLFAGRVQDLPYSRLSNIGKAVNTLHNFASMQADFFQKVVLTEGMKHGNWAPAFAGAAMLGISSTVIAPIIWALDGGSKTAAAELADLWCSNTFGSLGQTLQAFSNYKGSNPTTQSLLPPGIAATGRPIAGAVALAHGDVPTAYKNIAPNSVQQTLNPLMLMAGMKKPK